MNNDELMLELIKAKKEGLKITFGASGFSSVSENHAWDLNKNVYKIIRPREYIIHIPTKGDASIQEISNNWTRSDFGMTAGGDEYILMREVFKEDIK